MAKNSLSNGSENREVSTQQLTRQPKKSSPLISKNAAFFAAALVAAGCADADSSTQQENLGRSQQALSSEAQWDDPSLTPAMPWATAPSGQNGAPNVTISGATIDVLFHSTQPGGSGSSDIWIAESTDGGQTWPTVQPIAASGIGTAINSSSSEVAPVVFSGGTKVAISRNNKIQFCDIDLSAKTAGNCQSVGANINKIGHVVFPLSVNNGVLYYTDQNPTHDDIFSTPVGALPLAAGTSVSSLNTPTGEEDGVSFNGNYGVLTTTGQSGNLGGYDIYAFDWVEATKTATNITNINAIIGSFGNINNINDQGSPFLDTAGNLWYESNGVIYKAQKKTGTGTGGSGGAAGSSSSGGMSGTSSSGTGGVTTGPGTGGAGTGGAPATGPGGSTSSSGTGGVTTGPGTGGAGAGGAPATGPGGAGGAGTGGTETTSTGGTSTTTTGPGGMGGAGGAGGSAEAGSSSSGSSGTGGGPDKCKTEVVDKMDSAECKVDCTTQSIETVTLKDGNCVLKYTDDTGYTLMTLSNGDFAKGKELLLKINGDGTGTPTSGLSFDKVEDHGSGFHLQQSGFEAGPLGTGYRWQYKDEHTVKASVVYDTVLFKINGLPVQIPNTSLIDGKITGDQKPNTSDTWNHADSDPSITVDLNTLSIINSTFKSGSNLPGNKPPENGGGCTCADVANSTSSDLNAFFMAAGLGILIARRRKGFVGVESK